MPTRRIVLLTVTVLVVAGVAFTVWQAWRVQKDLERAEASVAALRTALDADDAAARDEAIADLQEAAGSADDRAGGAWWGALTHVPLVGDDVQGVRVLSSTLDRLAADAVGPLATSIDELDGLMADDRIDLATLATLREPVGQAHEAFAGAAEEVNDLDSSGFVGPVGDRYDDYVEQVNSAAAALEAGDTAIEVLPDLAGADGPRDYLLLFQNNAEIRATGGMPGSWALIHAEDGRLEMTQQGTALDFPQAARPVLPLTEAEVALYGPEIGTYFQDPGFTPDFPRAAELWRAHWDRQFPDTELDGVLALDPVGMSYLLEGTGPVAVGRTTLASDTVVDQLLSKPYLELAPAEQDAFFAEAARAVFDAATGDLASPTGFVEGLSRATREGRFLMAPFDADDAERLEGTEILGAMPTDDDGTPYVDIGLNDTTGSKMSYYLRYRVDIEPTSCARDRQELKATMKLTQSIRPDEAAALPASVTGGGRHGTDPGDQLVAVRVYGPVGGTIDDIRFDGGELPTYEIVEIDGRPAVLLAVLIERLDDVVVTWSMTTGEGQTDDVEMGVTPGVTRGSKDATFESACREGT